MTRIQCVGSWSPGWIWRLLFGTDHPASTLMSAWPCPNLLVAIRLTAQRKFMWPLSARLGLVLQSSGLVGVLTVAEKVEAPLQAGVLGRRG